MAVTEGQSAQQPRYVPRLLPIVVDQIAASEPERPYIYQAKSSRPEDGWAPVSFGELANAVNHVAHIISETVKKESTDKFPTLVYAGGNDVRNGIVILAAVKAGCQAFFVSPRNTVEGQQSLFKRTNCKHIWYSESFQSAVDTWTRGTKITSWQVPPWEEWLRAEPTLFPYTKTYEEARWDPLVVLHTSGSTGIPKPIIVRQGSMGVSDLFRHNLAPFHGGEFLLNYWKSHSTRLLSTMPGFHAAGVVVNFLTVPIYFTLPVALPPNHQPITAELAMRCLRNSGSDGALTPPSIIEELCSWEKGLEALKKLNFVSFGGGNLSKTAGDRLVEHGVTPSNIMGSTEHSPYALYFQKDPANWQYFVFNSEAMGAFWKPYDETEQVYELVFRRKDPHDPLDQPCFFTFPEKDEWSSGDLYKAHPTLKDNWMYQGRMDNVIVFSNGEKLNPTTIEDGVTGHPKIKGALVVGQDQFQPAIFLEPYEQPTSETEKQKLIEDVWPLIEELNKETVAHGRIVRQLVAITDPDAPLPRTPKGTVQRVGATRLYKQRTDELYRRADVFDTNHVQPLNISSQDSMVQSILTLLVDKMQIKHIEADQDFFNYSGMDSLQVLSLSRLLKASFEAAGVKVSPAAITPRAIYANSTPSQLAKHLYTAVTHANGNAKGSEQRGTDFSAWKDLVKKYTENLPARQTEKPEPREEGQTIVITGTTGSLGAYMLDVLCKLSSVKSVIALNRGDDGGASRQPGINSDRGLTTDFSKVTFLNSDLSKPDLGLGDIYKGLLDTCDRIIHNAWPVNFNISVSTFEPHIRGVRNLVDFSSAAAKQVPIVFVSSVGTVNGWTLPEPVPEKQFSDPKLAAMGYGLSKLAGSLILDAAYEQSGVPSASVRVGQIAGPRGAKGKWNPQEFLPSLVASSVHMGILPTNLGALEVVDWVAIEDVAGLILDIAGITQTGKALSDISGYFHCVNPHQVTWQDMALAIKDFYGHRIQKLVSFEEWFGALEKTAAADSADLDKNPAIKLLDTFQGFVQSKKAGQQHVYLEMKRTMEHSETAAKMEPVNADLMRSWCRQWNY
ncbi:putative secondary metabolism biosynthetic enzyme [Epichloe festucae Fl1]|uniref:Putative secondary metabolism biosynthetic enzyme n=1 Tax=Epichloe festucae (strain Fl1) TaxID=877507 RepID=A0A7S9KKM5_EPIFF|nr:putative secondary metabolism biosynthetic enzyme [Epichloe festucae Fl1]